MQAAQRDEDQGPHQRRGTRPSVGSGAPRAAAAQYPDQYAGAFGPVEVLPQVACVGAFHSTALDPAHDPVLHRSILTIIWFQRTTRVPSGCDAEEALREVDWEGLARDYEL